MEKELWIVEKGWDSLKKHLQKKGKSLPSLFLMRNLLKISSALEVSADYLLTGEIIDKDLLILSDKLRRLTPSQVRTVEAIIDECNNLFNQK